MKVIVSSVSIKEQNAPSSIVLCALLCHHMVFNGTECVVWRKMLGYVWDTSGIMFMLFLTCKNAYDLDSVGVAPCTYPW